ncbi:MAG: hypothetical protein IPM32_07395 [Ignavibacteriae bacterium]|nr:hypothetical protein [Ignavibacteriota bacterium]
MNQKSEPWYIHAALYVVIAILLFILVKVAIIDPTDFIDQEKYYSTESHLRMGNLRQAQILWEKKNKNFTDDLSALVNFVKSDSGVISAMNGIDSLTNKSTNPFQNLSDGLFAADSLMFSPKSHKPFLLQVDTVTTVDTVINVRGDIIKIDTTTVIGANYFIESPDGYGTIGEKDNIKKKHSASWE